MGRGSLLYFSAKLCEIIVSQFKDNVSQWKIANNLGLSQSTVHNIVKRFRESGKILVCKGQGWVPLLIECDHQALSWYCLRGHHATMMDIATWAREYFGKSLSLNTVHRCIKKYNLKLYYAKRKAFINFALKCRWVFWARSHLTWTERQWKRVLWSDEPTFQLMFFERNSVSIWRQDSILHELKHEKDLTGLPAVQICLLLKMYTNEKFHCKNWYLKFPNDYKV